VAAGAGRAIGYLMILGGVYDEPQTFDQHLDSFKAHSKLNPAVVWIQSLQLQKLTDAFPQRTLCISGIIYDSRCCIEAHGRSAAEIVPRPTGGSTSSKGDPCGVHSVGEVLWRVWSQERLSPGAECVEDECDL